MYVRKIYTYIRLVMFDWTNNKECSWPDSIREPSVNVK
jgi:hypothetical protein